MSEIESKVLNWLLTGNSGMSSRCMAAHLTGRTCDGSYPHDSVDFSKCGALLRAAPELRDLLPRMAEVNLYWKALVLKWAAIEAIDDPRVQSEFLTQILKPIQDQDRRVTRLGPGAILVVGNP